MTTTTWNEQRFYAARQRYRRRLLPRLLGLFACLIAIGTFLAFVLGGGIAWLVPGFMAGFAFTVFSFLDEFAPEHMRRRQRGLLGEVETQKVLRALERDGWDVQHGIDVGKGDLDHLISGRHGVYALETKTLLGHVTLEDDVLVTRQEDDPEEVHRWESLPGRMRSLAATISGWVRSDAGVPTWVQPVVVVWGEFEQRVVEADGVVYLHGRELVAWLRGRPLVRTEISIERPT